ncbi:uncharacterized protein LOC115892259 [Rhinopithecus roxellana]|uniref:uncharacterized protein LOC115892259 n=1 Tax=Rhinopithecus roxellana TaxID=61622 RepID=UPI00123790C5|nr:uncharacterized protein LOC115892259 [Rhinopithecus roxellana]
MSSRVRHPGLRAMAWSSLWFWQRAGGRDHGEMMPHTEDSICLVSDGQDHVRRLPGDGTHQWGSSVGPSSSKQTLFWVLVLTSPKASNCPSQSCVQRGLSATASGPTHGVSHFLPTPWWGAKYLQKTYPESKALSSASTAGPAGCSVCLKFPPVVPWAVGTDVAGGPSGRAGAGGESLSEEHPMKSSLPLTQV